MHACSIVAAVVREKGGAFTIEGAQLDEPRPNEVLVQIHGTGIRHTDLIVRNQLVPFPLPAVLGHEGAGIVELVGSEVTKVVPGDHVVLSFDSCGSCVNCVKGIPAYCREFFRYNFSGCRDDQSPTLSCETGKPLHGSFFG
jgi:aryl-alcohol dehydrogenase